ncbi:hypothetical protein [Paenibacillus thermotolerans]|uniref:hypothetical protein n=1 Tax=Paenibacillus thermotolerans TaxID=3027807 RepID=UPI002367DF31|nr:MULTISPECIES: hypothetical protein [unclassified Paenibacillus]
MNKRFTAIFLTLVMAFVAGCAQTTTLTSNEPPNAVANVEEQQFPLIKGSYQWKNAIADAPSPDDLVKNTTVYFVKPNAELTLDFKGEPPNEITVGLWGSQENLPTKGRAFVLPKEPGRYVLTVWGIWSGNDRGSYAAAIEVTK